MKFVEWIKSKAAKAEKKPKSFHEKLFVVIACVVAVFFINNAMRGNSTAETQAESNYSEADETADDESQSDEEGFQLGIFDIFLFGGALAAYGGIKIYKNRKEKIHE